MVEKIEKPQSQLSDEDLLEQVRLASEKQAAKFVRPTDTAALPVTTKTESKIVPGKTDTEGEKVKKEIRTSGKKATGRRRGGRGAGRAVVGNQESSVPTHSPVSEDKQVVVTKDPDVDVSGMLNPYLAGSLTKIQGEMDDIASGKMPAGAVPDKELAQPDTFLQRFEIKSGGANVVSPVEAGEPPVLENVFKMGKKAEKVEARQGLPAETASGEEKGGVPDAAMEALYARVDAARHEYVQEDYENTNRWLKMKNFFRGIKQEKSADTEYYQAQYNNTLIDLRNAELAKIKQSGLEGKELHEALAGMLKYFKYDELVNASQERTQVRAEHQGWSGKVMGMMERVGREYNDLSFKEKALTAGVMFGLAGVTGGASLLARRLFAGAGAAVALEAVIEKMTDARQDAKAEEEAFQQVEMLEKNNFWKENRSHEADIQSLNEMLEEGIFSLDKKLQQKKRGALLRKITAFGAGFGGGYFAKELFDMVGGDELAKGAKETVMNTLGGNEAVDWVKEQFSAPPSGAVPLSGTIEAPDVPSAPPSVSDVSPETPDVQSPHEVPETSDSPIESENPTGAEEAPASSSVAESAAEAGVGVPDTIDTFLSQENIPIEKGDSVWGIAGRLANELGLEEGSPQSTRFINTLKEQIGDVQLRAGETINFSEYGIDREFVENALKDANMLTPEQMASIADNDARIAEFSAANPDVTLTNESVDAILRDSADVSDTDTGQAIDSTETAVPSESLDELPQEAEIPSSIVEESADKEGFKSADINSERDIVFGKEYNLKNYTEYFRQNPEEFVKFKDLGDQYFAYIFPGNPDDMKTIGSMRISDFHGDPNQVTDDLHQFIQTAKETYGSKLGLPSPKEKVYEYVARMAMLGIEHPTGKRIIFPQYV